MSKYFLIALLFVSGCKKHTEQGPCIGISDREQEGLVYEVSFRNVVLAIIFSETIFVPVNVIFWNLKCPVGEK